jgi:5-methylcytosine-specific restriction enzyme B
VRSWQLACNGLAEFLERKGQAIIFGPPGTGKTHWARIAARDLAAIGAFGRPFAELTSGERDTVEGASKTPWLVRWCTFHPAYGYEDFIEVFRPQQNEAKQLIFEPCPGIFKKLCDDARVTPSRKFILVVDEINRGDIPRIWRTIDPAGKRQAWFGNNSAAFW